MKDVLEIGASRRVGEDDFSERAAIDSRRPGRTVGIRHLRTKTLDHSLAHRRLVQNFMPHSIRHDHDRTSSGKPLGYRGLTAADATNDSDNRKSTVFPKRHARSILKTHGRRHRRALRT